MPAILIRQRCNLRHGGAAGHQTNSASAPEVLFTDTPKVLTLPTSALLDNPRVVLNGRLFILNTPPTSKWWPVLVSNCAHATSFAKQNLFDPEPFKWILARG